VTVRRVGPAPEEAEPHRTNLGRVLVTIDDLAALRDFLMRDHPNVAPILPIEFDGGDFDEPEDLSSLSDVETRSLRIKTAKVEVVLNPSAAFAVGDRQEAENVYRLWARARQTRRKPLPFQQLTHTLTYIVTLGVMGAMAISIVTQLLNKENPTAREVFFYVLATVLSVLATRALLLFTTSGHAFLCRGDTHVSQRIPGEPCKPDVPASELDRCHHRSDIARYFGGRRCLGRDVTVVPRFRHRVI
jgi:hypothetical protein